MNITRVTARHGGKSGDPDYELLDSILQEERRIYNTLLSKIATESTINSTASFTAGDI